MEQLTDVIVSIRQALNYTLFADVTLWTLLYLAVLLTVLIFVAGQLKRWVARSLAFGDMEVGLRQSIAAIVRYVFMAIGLIIIIQTAGIDLSTLTVLAGAAGLGIGFGLQNIINNFLSGLIILFERPIKVGDRVDVGSVHGDVVNISARATTVVTNDNIAIIVPNADFISSKVTNWSYTDRKVRFDVPVGVSYESDPEVVTRLLLEVANAHKGVLTTPPSGVLFEAFGDSSLNFTLQVWTKDYSAKPRVLKSELNYAIARIFKENNIEIPFPQRVVHIRGGELGAPSQNP